MGLGIVVFTGKGIIFVSICACCLNHQHCCNYVVIAVDEGRIGVFAKRMNTALQSVIMATTDSTSWSQNVFDLIPYFTCDALDNNTELYILMKHNFCMSNMSRLGHAKRKVFDPQEIGPLEF